LGTHLFVKVPRPRDSEETFTVFESNFHLLLPVWPLIRRGNPVKCLAQRQNKRTCHLQIYLHTIPLLCWTSSSEAVNTNFWILLVWLGQGIEPRSTDF